jgi:hypothetical protein
MSNPLLIFCPYLELSEPIDFAGWRIGPVSAFETAWPDQRFKERSITFLKHFTDANGNAIEKPSLVGRNPGGIDGQAPQNKEIEALELALDFAFIDGNPRFKEGVNDQGWRLITTDNTELFIWPIDLETGHVTVSTGSIIRLLAGGFQIDDEDLEIRSPLELRMPGAPSADPDVLAAVYDVCLTSCRAPGTNPTADRMRAAIRWLAKAWKNSESIDFGDRVVFIKTGFEALTATSNSRESARRLRQLFESVPGTTAADAELLMWSPTEQPKHPHTYRGVTEHLTDLEDWFMALASARNTIIHDGIIPSLRYQQPGSRYEGPLFHSGQFVLRVALKVSLGSVGHTDIWRARAWRLVKASLNANTPPQA